MGSGFGEEAENHNASDDETDPENGWQVEQLMVDDNSGNGNQKDAKAGPNGVGDSDGDEFERQGKEIESNAVAGNDQGRGQEPGESLRGLKRRGGKDLGNDGDKEE